MEGNVLLPEFVPPQQSHTSFLTAEDSFQLSHPTSGHHNKQLKHNDPHNEPLQHLQRVIGQLELMDSLYNQAQSYLNMDNTSADTASVPSHELPQNHPLPTASTTTTNNNNLSVKINKQPSALAHTAQPAKMKACRAPLSRRFAHPCSCDSKNYHKNSGHHNNNHINVTTNQYQPFPLYLYDPLSRKCLPTSRQRDMLLRDCLPQHLPSATHHQNSLDQLLKQQQQQHQASAPTLNPSCIYDDLKCDPRRLKCVCKPSLHLYYESNWSSFGCVPINFTSPPDGVNCRKDQIYNVISKECQKIFDINDLPSSYMSGLSANQFPFVTLALIWVLLLIVILTAKLRKIRTTTSHHHRHSSSLAMRNNRASLSQQRQYSYYGPPTLVHSIMAAFHGHQHLNHGGRRSSLDTNSDPTSRSYNDTDFFLNRGPHHHHRDRRDLFMGEADLTNSQQSLNNPPPKFEDIYPSCPLEPPPLSPSSPGPPRAFIARPLSNDNLPSYHEAMKLQNTKPPDGKE